MKIIFDYNRTIFNPDEESLYEGVLEVLNYLSLEHELYLISANEPGRRQKMKDFGIDGLFKKVIFVNRKSVDIFKLVAKEGEDVFVVGDNIYGEISIGNKMNFNTVLLNHHNKKILPITTEHKPKHKIDNIYTLRDIVKKYT
jgi:FMN phosphatase YigB (HAD superfamily)